MAYPILAEKRVWLTQGNSGFNRDYFTEIAIMTSYTPTGNEDASWDGSAVLDGSITIYVDGTKLVIVGNGEEKIALSPDSQGLFCGFDSVIAISGLDKLDTSNVTNISLAFDSFGNADSPIECLDLSSWDVSNVTTFKQLIRGAQILSINLTGWDVGSATDMSYMFGHVLATTSPITTIIASFENWDTSNVTNMGGMFYQSLYLTSLDGVGSWDTSNVTNMAEMFYNCTALTSPIDLSSWDTSNVISMAGLFNCCADVMSGIANWDTSSLTKMEKLFYCTSCNANLVASIQSWNTSNVTNMNRVFYKTSVTSLDLTTWDVSKVTDMEYMFGSCESLTTLNVSNWNISNVTNIVGMFYNCNKLPSIDVSAWDTSAVSNMNNMFESCRSLSSLDVSNWDTSKVTGIRRLFFDCNTLASLDVSNWDTSSITTMNYTFYGCRSLTSLDVSNWDTSKVTDMESMFCSGLSYSNSMKIKNIDVSKWNTGNVLDMSFMFYGAGALKPDVSNWNVSKVVNFDHMFAHSHLTVDTSKWKIDSATNLGALFHTVKNEVIDVSGFNTSQVTGFGQMFEYCSNLKTIKGLENFDTSNGVDFQQMFSDCTNLTELDLSSFDTRKAKSGVKISTNGGTSAVLSNMFNNTHRLQKITLGENFSFDGDGTATWAKAVLPTPSSEYIPHANGYWYNEADEAILATDVPTKTAGVYYAMSSKYRRQVLVSYGSMEDIAIAIREKTGVSDLLRPIDMPGQIDLISGTMTVITSIENDTLVLEHNQDARLGELSTLMIALPEDTSVHPESYFNFTSGATATVVTCLSPIIWKGDDCNSNGEFIPEPNINYEVGVKCLGLDDNGDRIMVARVGVY